MADLAEILTLEHLAIRHIRKASTNWKGEVQLSEFHGYLKNCHIEIEEKIFFPVLKGHSGEDSKGFIRLVDQIIADHRLIDTLFLNLVKWSETGETKLYGERLPLYFRLLEEHNDKEEDLVFPRWRTVPSEDIKDTLKEAVNVIESYGLPRYMKTIGITKSGYRYAFNI